MPKEEVYDREKGIQAIIALQAVAGITESREKAGKGWDAMSDWEKSNTTAAHKVVCGGFTEN